MSPIVPGLRRLRAMAACPAPVRNCPFLTSSSFLRVGRGRRSMTMSATDSYPSRDTRPGIGLLRPIRTGQRYRAPALHIRRTWRSLPGPVRRMRGERRTPQVRSLQLCRPAEILRLSGGASAAEPPAVSRGGRAICVSRRRLSRRRAERGLKDRGFG
jgi:hypothetical protein